MDNDTYFIVFKTQYKDIGTRLLIVNYQAIYRGNCFYK